MKHKHQVFSLRTGIKRKMSRLFGFVDVLPLSLRSRAELDLNFITITITKAMITKANTTAISTARTGLKLNCHTLPAKT